MQTPDIISATLAVLTFIGIIVALGLGVWSIRESRNWQKISYKDKLMSEVIDWALEVLKTWLSHTIIDLPTLEKATKDFKSIRSHQIIIMRNLEIELAVLENRGQYLQDMVSPLGNQLQNAFVDLMDSLYKDIASCAKYRKNFAKTRNVKDFTSLLNKWDEEKRHTYNETKCISRIIREATNIRTKGII